MQKAIYNTSRDRKKKKLLFETWVGNALYSIDQSCGNEKVEWIKSWATDGRNDKWWIGKVVSLKVRYGNQRPKTIMSVKCESETKQE